MESNPKIMAAANGKSPPTVAGENGPAGGRKFRLEFNIERLRIVGLYAMILLFHVGFWTTKFFVVYPPRDDPTPWHEKVFRLGYVDFATAETYTYKLFGFFHTCNKFTFDPARTLSAAWVASFEIPTALFLCCNYLRVQSERDRKFDTLKRFNKISLPLELVGVIYLYMLFVNPPDELRHPYGTDEGWWLYLKGNAIPLLGYQISFSLMTIQQSWYFRLKQFKPTGWFTSKTTSPYYVLFVLIPLSVYYVCFIWFAMFDNPIHDKTKTLWVNPAFYLIMAWNMLCIVAPISVSSQVMDVVPTSVIEFSMLDKKSA